MYHFHESDNIRSVNDHTKNLMSIDQIKKIIEFFMTDNLYVDKNGKHTDMLQAVIYLIEKEFILTEDASVHFQQFIANVGAKTNFIKMPKETPSFWHLQPPIFNQNNFSHIPSEVDICIVGLGLTGISASYHLIDFAKTHKIIILEAEYPGAYSSGRNGGNFQLFPEFITNIKNELIEKKIGILQLKYKNATYSELYNIAINHAKTLLTFTLNNYKRMHDFVKTHNIDCDYSAAGWLRLASTIDEDSLIKNETEWLASVYGNSIVSLLTSEEIKNMFNFDTQFCGRIVKQSGNYNPIKFINSLLEIVTQNGIQLFTNTKVLSINETDNINVTTTRGLIKTKKIIFATNVFTPEIFPELRNEIKCIASQIMNLEHVTNNLHKMTCTEKMGRAYYNFPLSAQNENYGMLHFGYDFDLDNDIKNPREIPVSQKIYDEMKQITDERYPDTKNQPPSRLWTGALAFTPDAVPIISFGASANIVIAAGFQGFGGSFCVEAGYIATEMIKTEKYCESAPSEIFGIDRFKKIIL